MYAVDGLAEPAQAVEIGRVRLRTSRPLAFDPYTRNRSMGSFIVIDPDGNAVTAR